MVMAAAEITVVRRLYEEQYSSLEICRIRSCLKIWMMISDMDLPKFQS